MGAGVGLAVPALHGAAPLPGGSDWLAGGTGLILGVAGSQLVALGAGAVEEGTLTRLTLGPMYQAGAHGVVASGSW